MSEPHNYELHRRCLLHFNEPMLASDRLVRCIGYGESAVDCYVIAQHLHGEIVWLTCVGGYTFLDRLKGQGSVKATNGEDWDDLTRLDNLLHLNGAMRRETFILKLDHDDWEGHLPQGAKAKEVINHFPYLCPADMIEIRREITKYLAVRDIENGTTSWATEV